RGPIVYRTNLDGSTVANLTADLDSALVAAGATGRTAIPTGFKYVWISPQGLQCRIRIYEFNPTNLCVQLSNIAETIFGCDHTLRTGVDRVFQIHANPCQTFVSRDSI